MSEWTIRRYVTKTGLLLPEYYLAYGEMGGEAKVVQFKVGLPDRLVPLPDDVLRRLTEAIKKNGGDDPTFKYDLESRIPVVG